MEFAPLAGAESLGKQSKLTALGMTFTMAGPRAAFAKAPAANSRVSASV
jgi:hypothetical protein